MAAKEMEFQTHRELKSEYDFSENANLFLPNDLDVESLTFPCLKRLFDFSKLDVHIPCAVKLEDYRQYWC